MTATILHVTDFNKKHEHTINVMLTPDFYMLRKRGWVVSYTIGEKGQGHRFEPSKQKAEQFISEVE